VIIMIDLHSTLVTYKLDKCPNCNRDIGAIDIITSSYIDYRTLGIVCSKCGIECFHGCLVGTTIPFPFGTDNYLIAFLNEWFSLRAVYHG
jgi:hypothetical protein